MKSKIAEAKSGDILSLVSRFGTTFIVKIIENKEDYTEVDIIYNSYNIRGRKVINGMWWFEQHGWKVNNLGTDYTTIKVLYGC